MGVKPGLAALATILSQFAHTQGHFTQADKENIPIALDLNNFAEKWHSNNPARGARVDGAGFRAQDALNKAAEGTEIEPSLRTVSGLIKLGYALGVPRAMGGNIEGDLKGMDRHTGGNLSAPIIAAAGLGDLYRAYNPKSNFNLGFDQSENGTPLLTLSGKW